MSKPRLLPPTNDGKSKREKRAGKGKHNRKPGAARYWKQRSSKKRRWRGGRR